MKNIKIEKLKIKKWIGIALVLALVLGLAGCGASGATEKSEDAAVDKESSAANSEVESSDANSSEAAAALEVTPVTIRVAGLKGPTSMGMVKLISDYTAADSASGSAISTDVSDRLKLEFTLAGSADEITPLLIKGELDIAAIPANLASVLYNNTNGQIKTLAINTLGVLYIVSKGYETDDESAEGENVLLDIADLKGKTIYATGKGSTPEYTLRYILSENGIDPDKDVTIEFKSEPSEIVALLASQENGIAMLPQPYVTVAKSKVDGLKTVFDLTEEWSEINDDSTLVTGVLVARAEFLEEHNDIIKDFMNEYAESVDWVLANPAEAGLLIEEYGIVKAAVAEKAIPNCHMVIITGTSLPEYLGGYLEALYNQNPKSVGGKLPDANFYYTEDNYIN